MGTILQVEAHMAEVITQIVYPHGIDSPSITGHDVKVEIGFPIKNVLDTDVENDISTISIYPIGGMERNVTRYLREWCVISQPAQTIFLRLSGFDLFIEGAADPEQICLVQIGGGYYSYETVFGDTLNTVAMKLSAGIPGASFIGNVIKLPISLDIKTFVSTYALLGKEVKRQQKVYNMTVWAADVQCRAILGDAIDAYFAENTRQLLTADDFFIYFFYRMTLEEDMLQKNNIFKRSIEYNVEYPTVVMKKFNKLVTTDINFEIEQ